jgi:uncharacterized protein YjbI with pentapeptide repeats
MKELNNEELLELIKTDVEKFNNYRAEFPNQKIDFENVNFVCADLRGADFRGADFTGADLSESNLEAAKITLTKENIEAIKWAILNGSSVQG